MVEIKPTYNPNNVYLAMEEKIRPWLNKIETEKHSDLAKKQRELCQIGKLLVTYFDNFKIKELRESPDFLISNGKMEIGLEHQIIVESNTKSKEGYFENLCTLVEAEIANTTSLNNFAINLYFKKGIENHSMQKKEIISTLKSVVLEKITNDRLVPNQFVERVVLMKHNRISIIANFGAFMQRHLEETHIIEALSKKENLVDNYRRNSVQNQWLVMVVGQVSESSFEVRTDFELSNNSKFDRVFVFEDFNNRLFELRKHGEN